MDGGLKTFGAPWMDRDACSKCRMGGPDAEQVVLRPVRGQAHLFGFI